MVDPWPHQTRLRYSVAVSAPELVKHWYYWVIPRVLVPGQGGPQWGELSDSDRGDPDYDPANLRPVIARLRPGDRYVGPAGSQVTYSYEPSSSGPRPIVSQHWYFGNAAQEGPTSEEASPTITLTQTPGEYECALLIYNAFGPSEPRLFTIEVTPGYERPVVGEVEQQGTAPLGQATFTALLVQGPGQEYSWNFGGGATPNTSSEAEPTVTLSEHDGQYAGWVEVSNVAGASGPFAFTVKVGYPPDAQQMSVLVPEHIVVGEPAEFTALWNENASLPLEFIWDFDIAYSGEVENAPLVSVEMQRGGHDYTGHLTVKNYLCEEDGVTVSFNFDSYWNQILLHTYPESDITLSGEPGDFVTIVVEGYDLAYPLVNGVVVYLEYAEDQLALPTEDDLMDPINHLVWNAGNIGGETWKSNDGWWTPYPPLEWSIGELGRWNFFYDGPGRPKPSRFSEHEQHCCINSNLIIIESSYSSSPGDCGEFYNFRMCLSQEVAPGSFNFWTTIKCYRRGPNEELLTFYFDDGDIWTFSNEPELTIHCVGVKE